MTSKYSFRPGSPDLWRKFIDPADWPKALGQFPKAPWKYYLLPRGQYTRDKWDYFQRANLWVWNKALKNSKSRREKLTMRDIVEVNAVAMLGNPKKWSAVLRNNRPIFNIRRSEEIRRVYSSGTCFYKNADKLLIAIDGYWPEEEKSLEFFAHCRTLGAVSYETEPLKWKKAFANFKRMLYPKITKRAERWQVYFLTRRESLIRQLQMVLNWYNKKAAVILKLKSGPEKSKKVLELAVKMQRYMDISQFCMDGSGRTGKLIQDYIFLRFGYYPLNPVLYRAYGRTWENGTYLPLNKAIQMAQKGWVGPR
jgi:hypothetical protein